MAKKTTDEKKKDDKGSETGKGGAGDAKGDTGTKKAGGQKSSESFTCRACGASRKVDGKPCPACGAEIVPEFAVEVMVRKGDGCHEVVVQTYKGGVQTKHPFLFEVEGRSVKRRTTLKAGYLIIEVAPYRKSRKCTVSLLETHTPPIEVTVPAMRPKIDAQATTWAEKKEIMRKWKTGEE